MIYLDTNIVSKALRLKSPLLAKRLQAEAKAGTQLFLSVVVVHELWLSVYRSANPDNALGKTRAFLAGIAAVTPFDEEDARHAAHIRADLMEKGMTIGSFDNLIAAQALRRDALLVTNNVREFSRIPGLKWADWTQA